MGKNETNIDIFKTIFFYLTYKLVKWNANPMYLKDYLSTYRYSPFARSQIMTN